MREIEEIYIPLVRLIQQQPWANLIDWDLVNTDYGMLYFYRHGSSINDFVAYLISDARNSYSLIDIPNRKATVGDGEEILKALHRALKA